MSVDQEQDKKQDSREAQATPINNKLSRPSNGKLALILLVAIGLVSVLAFVLLQDTGRRVGDTLITDDEITAYANDLDDYTELTGETFEGGEPDEIAEKDLVLNAALKKEAAELQITVSQDDIDSVIEEEFGSFGSKEELFKYYDAVRLEDVMPIRIENTAYKNKLADDLLARKDFFMVRVAWDTPYHNNMPDNGISLDPQTVKLLEEEYGPLLRQGEPKEEIARQADVNILAGETGAYELYFEGTPVVAMEVTNYNGARNQFNDDGENLLPSQEGLVDTDEALSSLNEVGQVSEVFKSKAGFHAIVRLESKVDGKYNSWDEMLDYYMDDVQARLDNFIDQFIARASDATDRIGAFMDMTAKVEAQSSSCSGHLVTYNISAENSATGASLSISNLSVNQPCGACSPVDTTFDLPTAITFNCYNCPPTWGGAEAAAPEGFEYSHKDWSSTSGASGTGNVPTWSPSVVNGQTITVVYFYDPVEIPYTVRSDMIMGGASGGGGPNISGTFSSAHQINEANSDQTSSSSSASLRRDGNIYDTTVTAPATVEVGGVTYNRAGSAHCYNAEGSCRSSGSQTTIDTRSFSAEGTVNNGGIVRVYWFYEEDPPPPEDPPSPSACLADPIKTVTFPSRYNQSLSTPGGYSRTYGNERTRTRTTETRYVSHQDASSGGARIQLPHSNDSPGRPGSVDLDYRPYEDNYPFDHNVPRVNYEEDYTRRHYTATGSRVYSDITEIQRVCSWGWEYEAGGWEYVDGSWEYVSGRWRYVYSCANELVVVGQKFEGWRYSYSHTTYHSRSDSVNGPTMDPCWDRTFDFDPRISAAQLLDDRESPDRARATAFIDTNYSTEEPGRGRSDLRRRSSVNNFNYQISYRIDGGSWTNIQSGPTNISAPNDNKIINNSPYSPGSASIPVSVPGDLRVGQRVCFRLQTGSPTRGVMDYNGAIQSGSAGTRSAESCTLSVANWPYFKVFGNDIVSGGSFGSCLVSGGRISTRSRGVAGVGSSTQYAAFAVSTIAGFSSASLKPLSPANPPIPPTGLTFANNTPGGGQYSANDGSTCLPDYFASEEFASAEAFTGSGPSRSQQIIDELATENVSPRTLEWFNAGSTLTLDNGSSPIGVTTGARKVIYVEGELTINDNIEFDTNWNSRDDIPLVMFIARDITIAPSVTQLDGVYVAQPGGGGNGVIRTCSATSTIFSSCQNPLVVNGAFIADNVQFTRTRGSLRDAVLNEGRSGINPVNVNGNCSWTQSPSSDGTVGGDTCAAEIVSFSPEVYMALTQLLTPGESFQYDSYVTLPPNL